MGTLKGIRLPKNGYVRSVNRAISCFNKHIFKKHRFLFFNNKKHFLNKKTSIKKKHFFPTPMDLTRQALQTNEKFFSNFRIIFEINYNFSR